MKAETDNEMFARFMGWEKDPEPEFGWIKPDGVYDVDFDIDRFTTDYNLFVPVWNKAVKDMDETIEAFQISDQDEWSELYSLVDMVELNIKGWSFEISTRLPILKEIILFLDKQKA